MAKQFKTGSGELIKVPSSLKEAMRVLIRQIDDDLNPEEALYWLIWMMRMRGVPPVWPSSKVCDNLLKSKAGVSMKIGNFSAEIVGARETVEGYAALKMTNGKCPFALRLSNHGSVKAKVNVKIHGINQGTWILPPYDTDDLERPAHIAEQFCAYALGSEGGNAIGLQAGDPNNGLVQVKFSPAFSSQPVYRGGARGMGMGGGDDESYGATRGASKSFGAAGVGTEGHSDQTFVTGKDFLTDESAAVTISLRIVEDKEISTPRPLSSATGNPVPQAL